MEKIRMGMLPPLPTAASTGAGATHRLRQPVFAVSALLVALLPGNFLPPVVSDSVPATTKYREVASVAGSVGQIPCPVTSFDDVVMILWFKGSSGAPIYSYDARNEEAEPRHLTLKDEWGLRLYFRVWPNNRRSPALMIQDLKPGDGGLYRCRVDYRNSPTTNAVTRLRIIEPPTRLEIRDTSPSRPISDQQMMIAGNNKHSDPSVTYMGPYTEGQNVTLVCNAYGGKPLAEIRWYKNGEVVDTSYSLSGTEYAINEMTINNLGRNHTSDIYSCQANNNNETQALTHKVLLEIYFGVTSVELEIPSPMTAGTEYNLVCKTLGSYPTVKVELWKNLKRIASTSQMKTNANNVTITSIFFKPDVMDDGGIIICKAVNPWVLGKPSVARKTMKIKYAPIAVLRLAKNRTTAFAEGESALMECHVKANPPAHTIHWFHEGRELSTGSNETAGIRINGMTLFISYLSYRFGGNFNCEAVNEQGKGNSNTLSIEVHLSPKCVNSEATLVPLALGETQWLTCNILAWPSSDLNFYWTLNRSDGEKMITKNLTETTRLPISLPTSRASDMNSVGNKKRESESNSLTSPNNLKDYEEGKAEQEQLSKNRNGSPQLSSGSSSESLDYPEDQHIPAISSSHIEERMKSTTTSKTSGDIKDKSTTYATDRGTTASKSSFLKVRKSEKGSSSLTEKKDTLLEEIHSTGEKAISEKSMTYSSSSNVVVSTSKGNATSSNNNFNSSTIPERLSFLSDHDAKLTFGIGGKSLVVAGNGDRDHVAKSKRHVYPSAGSTVPTAGTVSSGGSGININSEAKVRDVRFQDKIRHTSFISYQVKSNEDFGSVVSCWAKNTFGSQVFPCLFHIIRREDDMDKDKDSEKTKGANRSSDGSEAGSGSKSKNLTALSTSPTSGKEQLRSVYTDKQNTKPHLGFSKLQKTLGIVVLLILIFIAILTGFAFAMLFFMAKRQSREIRRIVIAHGPATRRKSSSSSRSSPLRSKNGNKGASPPLSSSMVNKNTTCSSNTEITTKDNENTFPCSHDMFVVSTKELHPFQEIQVEERNKEKPQLSYISTFSTPESNFVGNKAALNNGEKGTHNHNHNAQELMHSIRQNVCENTYVFPERIMDTSHSHPQVEYLENQEKPISDHQGFRSMTPRAVELIGSDIVTGSYFNMSTIVSDTDTGGGCSISSSSHVQVNRSNNDNENDSSRSSITPKSIEVETECRTRTSPGLGQYCSHLDKDCLLSPNDSNTYTQSQ